MPNVNIEKLIPTEQLAGEDAEETAQLREMLKNATNYLRNFGWCPPIDRIFFGCGIGQVVAVFLFHFQNRIYNNKDEWLWVIEGDLPPAYIVLDQASNPASALEIYCQLMDAWANAVLEGKSLKDVFHVEAEPSFDNAQNLLKRIKFIRTQLLPDWLMLYSKPSDS